MSTFCCLLYYYIVFLLERFYKSNVTYYFITPNPSNFIQLFIAYVCEQPVAKAHWLPV